jgi:DNA-directed RNA polymerase subunit RPC12/RpoP
LGLTARASLLGEALFIRGANAPLLVSSPSPIKERGIKGVMMEKRKEYAEGELITCPRCGSDDLDCEEAPDQAKCLTCGLKFAIRQVAVWEE